MTCPVATDSSWSCVASSSAFLMARTVFSAKSSNIGGQDSSQRPERAPRRVSLFETRFLRDGVQEPAVPVSLPRMTARPPEGLQRLLDEAPFVRLLARALLADEADDVVQQTWLCAMRHGGGGVAEPRSWLARIARNVARNLRRGDRRRQRHENAAAPAALVPSSAELMAREEQRHALVRAVDTLPPPLRTVVLLR